MGRVYLFSDEAGNFDFRIGSGATKYFVLGTVVMKDTSIGNELIELRRELAWDGVGLESCFHATEDKQVVRDNVFDLLDSADFRGRLHDLREAQDPVPSPDHGGVLQARLVHAHEVRRAQGRRPTGGAV